MTIPQVLLFGVMCFFMGVTTMCWVCQWLIQRERERRAKEKESEQL